MSHKLIQILDQSIRWGVLLIVTALALLTVRPVKAIPPAKMSASLWSTQDHAYIAPGAQFKIFKTYLPKAGRISLILDQPNNASTAMKELSYDAQNFLAPLVINLETAEPAAIVFCSSREAAAKRLAETGYVWTYRIGQGKGLARKKT